MAQFVEVKMDGETSRPWNYSLALGQALNVISKFTFIIWMQRMKMVHQRKLEAARELYGLSPSDEVNEDELKKRAATGKAGNSAWLKQLSITWDNFEGSNM